jgi:hypothetical protein
VSSSTGETYYLNTVTGESDWDFPTKAATEEGVPPENPAESVSKIIVAKSNAGFDEGENARAKIQSELTQLENAVEGTSASAAAASSELEDATAAAGAALEEARAAGAAEDVLQAKTAAVLAASDKAMAASNTARQTAEEVAKSIKRLRAAVNGASGDLATTNAQLRKENEALREALGEKLSATIDLSGKKTVSSKQNSPKSTTAPPASPAGVHRRATTPNRGSAGDYKNRKAELLKARREFEEQKAAAEAAAKEVWTGEPKARKVALDDAEAVLSRTTAPFDSGLQVSFLCVDMHPYSVLVVVVVRCLQVKAEAVRREQERARKAQAEADRKAELQAVRMRDLCPSRGPHVCVTFLCCSDTVRTLLRVFWLSSKRRLSSWKPRKRLRETHQPARRREAHRRRAQQTTLPEDASCCRSECNSGVCPVRLRLGRSRQLVKQRPPHKRGILEGRVSFSSMGMRYRSLRIVCILSLSLNLAISQSRAMITG